MAGFAQGNLRRVAGGPSLQTHDLLQTCISTPRRDTPGILPETFRPWNRGRGERRVPAAPAASCALSIGRSTRV